MGIKAIRSCYPQGKIKAFTLSYDDGNVADRKLVGMFNKYGLKGTFHLNSGPILNGDPWRISKEEIRDLYAGHEISIHSLTHPFLDRCQKDVMVTEVLEVPGALGVVYSRTTQATGTFALPQNWLLWHPTAHHSHRILSLAETFLARKHVLDLLYVWGHSFEFDRENCEFTWKQMEEFCEKMSGHEEIWYATNIEIHDYIQAQRSLIYTVDKDQVFNPSAIPVWILVDEKPLEVPSGKSVAI